MSEDDFTKQVRKIQERAVSGELDLRQAGEALTGKWDQDFIAELLRRATEPPAPDDVEERARNRLNELHRSAKVWSEVAEKGDEGNEPLPQALDALNEAISIAKAERKRADRLSAQRGEVIEGCNCQSCGQPFHYDVLVPDAVWEQIKPDGKPEGGGLLCPTCILSRCVERCGWTVGFLYSDRQGPDVVAGKSAAPRALGDG